MTGTERTIQLRRYVVADGLLEEFTGWWRALLVPAREVYGFAIEFAYALPESGEFVWAVALPGDRDHFRQVEEAYIASPERATAFDGRPTWTTSQIISFANSAV